MIINKAQGQTLNLVGMYPPWPVVFHMASCIWQFSLSSFDVAFVIIHGCPQLMGNDILISETLYIEESFKVCNI